MAPKAGEATIGVVATNKERKRAMMATIPPFQKSGQRFTATHMVVNIESSNGSCCKKKTMNSITAPFIKNLLILCEMLQQVAAGALAVETEEGLDSPFVCLLADVCKDVLSVHGQHFFAKRTQLDAVASPSHGADVFAVTRIEEGDGVAPSFSVGSSSNFGDFHTARTGVGEEDQRVSVHGDIVEVASCEAATKAFEIERIFSVGHMSSLYCGAAIAPVVSTAINVIAVIIAIMYLV